MPDELSVEDNIPEKFRELFPFGKFNRVQSIVLPSVLNTDENIVVCAPTASGKTVVAELAIIRQLTSLGKTLYLGPLKALTYEKEERWGEIFNKLGYKVYITTGDEEISPYEANSAQIIVSTPEKWDSASRKWNKRGYNFVNNVSLLVIDEVHLLDSDNRGGVLEAIVSRMRRLSEVNYRPLRIIALSATMSNYREVAEWIGAKESFTFNFDSSARPVPLSLGVYQYNETNNKFYDMYVRLYKALDLSNWVLDEGNQVLIFVASRRDTRLAANKIAKVWEEQAISYCTPEELAELKKNSNQIRNRSLREVFSKGVAFHHAGLSREDRMIVENSFRNGLVKILVSTSTLAWGVNLPAKVVIIRDTNVYDTLRGEREINPLDVLQMLGRAGRPQYDKEGIGWVIVRSEDVQKYRTLLLKERDLESRLLETLPEHLNAEIVLGTVESEEDALNWIKTSFLYIREKNRRGESALNFLENEIRRKVRWLEEHGFIIRENNKFKATKLAEIACNYYLDLETAELFCNKVKDVSDETDILSLVSRAKEFEDIVVRRVEKKFLKTVLSNIDTPFKEELNEPQKKVLAILISYLKQIKIMEDLRADSWIIKQNSLRLLAALERFATELTTEDTSRSIRLLNFKLEKGALDEQIELIQVPGIGTKTVDLLLSRSVKTLDQLLQMSAYDLTRIGLPPKTSKKILKEAKNLPKATISVKINQTPDSENVIELQTTVQNSGKPGRFLISIMLNNKEILKKSATISKDTPWNLPLKLNISNSPIENKVKIDYLDLFRAPETLQTTIKPPSKPYTDLKLESSLIKIISEEESTTEKAIENQLTVVRNTVIDQSKKISTPKKSVYSDLKSFTTRTEPIPIIQRPEIRKKEKIAEPPKLAVGICKICGDGLSQEDNKIICKECGTTYKLPRNGQLTDQKCSKCGLPKFKANYVFPIQACIDRSCENADNVIQRKFNDMNLKCPNCDGSLVFLRRRGLIAGCENYYKGCRTAFKLPTTGVLLNQKCPKCNLPLVKLKTKTRCLNTKCEINNN
ncbi:MAG: DEAD/DEAH box helicase [Candidatus Lokiarchaeia archaeon]